MTKSIHVITGILALACSASAQVTVYDNTANDDSGFDIGGASLVTGPGGVNPAVETNTAFQEIHLGPGYAGQDLAGITADLFNSGSTTVTQPSALVGLWNDSNGGMPGSFIISWQFFAILTPGLNNGAMIVDLKGQPPIPLPADGNLWVGITFDEFSTGNTATDLHNAALIDDLSMATTQTSGGTPLSQPSIGSTNGLDYYAPPANNPLGYGYVAKPNPPLTLWGSNHNFAVTLQAFGSKPPPPTSPSPAAGVVFFLGLTRRRKRAPRR